MIVLQEHLKFKVQADENKIPEYWKLLTSEIYMRNCLQVKIYRFEKSQLKKHN